MKLCPRCLHYVCRCDASAATLLGLPIPIALRATLPAEPSFRVRIQVIGPHRSHAHGHANKNRSTRNWLLTNRTKGAR